MQEIESRNYVESNMKRNISVVNRVIYTEIYFFTKLIKTEAPVQY